MYTCASHMPTPLRCLARVSQHAIPEQNAHFDVYFVAFVRPSSSCFAAFAHIEEVCQMHVQVQGENADRA